MLPHPASLFCLQGYLLPEGYPDLFQASDDEPPDPDALKSYLGAEVNWVLRTYLLFLKRKKLDVSISPRLVSGKICVVAPYRLRIRDYNVDSFVVGCRADFARPAMCDMSIVQNQANVETERDIMIPHWPSPGLLPRLQERGTRIENMAFMGRSWNLAPELRSPDEFLAELAALGVRFDIHDELESPTPNWSDYRNCDLTLAVRNLTEQDALVKPASKLVNAWIAGVPALLGPEPAFRDLRETPFDYVEVKTPREALDAIRRLKSNPDEYNHMIVNGLKRAEEFSIDRIAQTWVNALAGPVAQQYGRWLKSGRLARLAMFPARAIRQKVANRAAVYHQQHGCRIISKSSVSRPRWPAAPTPAEADVDLTRGRVTWASGY